MPCWFGGGCPPSCEFAGDKMLFVGEGPPVAGLMLPLSAPPTGPKGRLPLPGNGWLPSAAGLRFPGPGG